MLLHRPIFLFQFLHQSNSKLKLRQTGYMIEETQVNPRRYLHGSLAGGMTVEVEVHQGVQGGACSH